MEWLGVAILIGFFILLAILAGQVERPADPRKVRDRVAHGGYPVEAWEV